MSLHPSALTARAHSARLAAAFASGYTLSYPGQWTARDPGGAVIGTAATRAEIEARIINHAGLRVGGTEYTTSQKEIVYDPQTRDYAMYLNGALIGFARTYHEADVTLATLTQAM